MWVKVYDEKHRLNMKKGKNFDKVLAKISPLVKKMALQYIDSFSLTELEDLEQDLYVIALEGLKAFDPSRGTKFSTFLHHHLENRLITLLRHGHLQKKHASFHYIKKREDGTIFARPATSLSFKVKNADESRVYAQATVPMQCSIYQKKTDDFDSIDFRLSLDSLCNKYTNDIPKSVRKCLEEIYFEDKNIKEVLCISEKTGKPISSWATSMRIKKASRRLQDLRVKNAGERNVPAKSKLNRVFHL